MYLEHQQTIIVSSMGGDNQSTDGSSFEVNLQDGLQIPLNAKHVNIAVEDASIWWTIPNIITGVNDKLYVTGLDNTGLIKSFDLTIPQGLYDIVMLQSAIERELENAGALIKPSHLFTLNPDEPTNRVEIDFNHVGTSIDFSQPNTFREVLGFDAQVYTAPNDHFRKLGQSIARFNQIDYFLIHSNLTNKGMLFNHSVSQSIARIMIDVKPGSLIHHTPNHPSHISAPELAGSTQNTFKFWLTDDKNRYVNTNGESWSARIVIRYSHLV